jgi:hypothetical protein
MFFKGYFFRENRELEGPKSRKPSENGLDSGLEKA